LDRARQIFAGFINKHPEARLTIGGPEALDDRSPRPDRVWNRIPDDIRARVVTLALDEPELSPRELAVRFGAGGVVAVEMTVINAG
jgi:hypothetical protein